MHRLAHLVLDFNRSMCDVQRTLGWAGDGQPELGATDPRSHRDAGSRQVHDDPTMHRAEMPPTGSLSLDFADGEGCDEYETWVEWCLMHGLEDGDGD